MIGTAQHFADGYAVGLEGWRIEDDWGGYPTQYLAGWECGYAMWRVIHSYWGA